MRALLFPGACLLVALAAHSRLPRQSEMAALAEIVALVAAFALLSSALGCIAIATLTRMAATGWASVGFASRFGSRMALVLLGIQLVACVGILFPGILEVSVFGWWNWMEFNLFIIFWCTVAAFWTLVRLLRSDPRLPDTEPIAVWGRTAALEACPTLATFLDRVCAAAQCPLPRQVVLGLEPGVFCTRRPVHVGADVLSGGTLYISLPLCRALSTDEFAALAAAEISRSWPLTPDWAEWFAGARNRADRILSRELAQPARFVTASAFAPLRSWRDLWTAFQVLLARYGARRAAVSAGRENTAAAIVKGVLDPNEWTMFLREVQAEQRRHPGGTDNLSRRFADRLFTLPDVPEFLAPFRAESPALLEQKSPELAAWLALLDVRPSDIAAHLAAPPAEPALTVIDGAAPAEEQLSAELRQRVSIVRPAPAQ